jgi:Zn-dependent protease
VREYHVLEALYLGLALAIGLPAREYARAFVADRLGDPNPRRWGWLGSDPRVWIDPFGSVILPILLMILWAAGFQLPPFAYAKPLPFDPSNLRSYRRDVVLVSIAGPVANVSLAVLVGLLLRVGVGSSGGELCSFLEVFVLTQVTLAVFHLLPIPGLDGARMLALVMPPRAREVYRNLDQYLILFVLLIFFILGGIALSIVEALRDVLLDLVVGSSTC